MTIDVIAFKSPHDKLTSKERRKLRLAAAKQIKRNSPGASKGIVKQVAFNRSQQAFAAMKETRVCNQCGLFMHSSQVDKHECKPKLEVVK